MYTLLRTSAALFLALVLASLPFTSPAFAQTPVVTGLGPFSKGAVVSLKGTPHLWYADELGTLHWATDTRALANRGPISNSRTEVALEQLRTLPLGDPWLSTNLLKLGDAIYVVKWDTGDAPPTLLHVQSVADLQALGLSGAAAAQALDKAAWEKKYSVTTDQLKKAELATTGTAAMPETWVSFTSNAGGFSIWGPSFVATPLPSALAGVPNLSTLPNVSPEIAANLPTEVHTYLFAGVLDGPTVLYLAAAATLPQEAIEQVQAIGPDLLFEAVRSELLKQEGMTVLGFRAITQGTFTGRELQIQPKLPDLPDNVARQIPPGLSVPEMVITLRVFLVRNQLFVLGALNFPAKSTPPDVMKFMDSFRLLP